jgi:hypothetical protein
MDFMLSSTAGLQNSTAGRVKWLQKSSKTLQDQKKSAGNAHSAAGRVLKAQDNIKLQKAVIDQ